MTNKQKKCIGYLGSGRLYQAVQPYLEQEHQLLDIRSIEDLAQQAPQCSMILYCDDLWHLQTQYKINQQCLRLSIPWLRAYCEFGVSTIGPYVDPKEAGCIACVETRRRAAMRNSTDHVLLCNSLETGSIGQKRLSLPGQPWLTSSSLEILAQLVAQEVSACLETPETVQTRRAILCLDLNTFHCQRHRFLPEPECPACSKLTKDTAEAAIITLQARPKLGPSAYRIRSLKTHAKEIFGTYVDAQTGPISVLAKNTNDSVSAATAWIGISDGERQSQMSGTGRTLRYEQSQLAAIAEALERYGGQRPKTKRTTVYGSYQQLSEQALDPTILGLHTTEQYALPGFRYVPYHHDLHCGWVWGYSFESQAPILVPEHIGYYGLLRPDAKTKDDVASCHHAPDGTAFVYEISNGCALGNCLEEAIFYGILEVAERDAFLMTWYAQLSLPRIDPLSATDPMVGLMLENLEYVSGYTIQVFNSTLDHGAPCCWVMAIDEQDRDGMPKALCAASSHPNPEIAVLNALQELEMMVKKSFDSFEQDRKKALEMLTNPIGVKEMEDHSTLYYLPEAFERLNFLYHSPQPLQTFQDAFSDFYHRKPSMDLHDDLRALIDHYLARGTDIVVVNQTTPEHAAQDFHCVKVIMPGMLPMTFGHQHRRHTGFQRLYHLPYQLGYRNEPLTDTDINPHPHPFLFQE